MAYLGPNSRNLDVWLEAGLSAHRRGDLDGALESYRKILAVAPEHAAALNLLGTALLQLGNPAEATPMLERAARRQRNDPHLLANLAQAYLALGRHAQACETFRKAARIAPREAQLQIGIGATLALQGKLEEAQTLLERLTTRFPQAALVWLNLGNVFRDQLRPEAAIDAYRKALDLDPAMTAARNSLGSVLHSMLKFEDAEREYRACIAAAPEDPVPRYNLASVTMDLGRFDEAETVCREIVARAPADPGAHRLLGTAFGHQARLLDGLACYERAARMAPDDPQTARIYGTALMETGRAAAGLRWLAHAGFLEPDSIARRQVSAGALLAHGYLQDGWREYTCRPAALELREKYRALELASSLPPDLAGKHLCVLAEQGLGDQLFFLRYAALAAARGARVSCRPARKLHGLLQRVSAFGRVLPESADLPQADIYMLAGDLPLALGETPSSLLPRAAAQAPAAHALSDFARHIAVFSPPPAPSLRITPLAERLGEMHESLSRLGPPPYLGLTWRGGTAPEKQQTAVWLLYKSIALPALAGVLAGVPGTVVALQRKPYAGEIETLAGALGRPVHDLTALNDDLEGMLALLALLDEYIGVSNTNMHLRAAVGRSARVLVPVPAEWRWMQSGRSSPWFPGFPVYRQSLQGEWSDALVRLGGELRVNHGAADRSNNG